MKATEATDLLPINNADWILITDSIAQRDELLGYAESKGIPVWKPISGNIKEARRLGWLGDLMAYEACGPEDEDAQFITAEQFYAMCDAYAPAGKHTAPPAEHGVRDLLLGLVAALLFSGLLGSCAAPARLPLQAGVKSAEHDNRTKLVEPYAVVPAKSVR